MGYRYVSFSSGTYYLLIALYIHDSFLLGNQQSEPHVYNTGSADTNPSFTGSQASSSLYNSSAWDRPSAAKRDYTRGHQLDERFEEDRLRIVAREKRLVGGAAAIVGTLAVAAGWKAMIG